MCAWEQSWSRRSSGSGLAEGVGAPAPDVFLTAPRGDAIAVARRLAARYHDLLHGI